MITYYSIYIVSNTNFPSYPSKTTPNHTLTYKKQRNKGKLKSEVKTLSEF